MKKILSLLLAVLLVVSASVCALADPITLTDQVGREVTVEQTPSRIVSGYYISTSALIALGLQNRIVGIEAKAAQRPIYALSAPELIDLPNVGSAKEFNLEGCIALKPDLVILPKKLKDAAATLSELGIPVLLVNPESQEELEDMIALLGEATGTEERAAEILSYMDDVCDYLDEKLGDAEKPTVYLAGNGSLLTTAGSKMYQSGMVTLAGAENVAAEIEDTYWAEVSYEQLLKWNPDVIVLASDASYSVEDVMADENLADCTAVKNGAVYQMPGDAEAWDSPAPSGILGSVWLASVLHSDIIGEEECTDIINDFYQDFYGFSYQEG